MALAGYSSFLAIGGIAGMYGPMRTPLEKRFGVELGDTALMVQLHFVGAVLGLLVLPALMRRIPATPLMVLGCLLFSLASLALGFAPAWGMVLVAAFCLGLSFGLIDLGENALFSFKFAARRGLMLNLLNGMFAIGSVLAPFALAQIGRYPVVLAGLAALASFALVSHFLVGPTTLPHTEESSGKVSGGAVVPAFVAMYFCYVMVEVGVGAGFAKLLEAKGFTTEQAALWSAGFWGGLVISRFAYAAVADRLPARKSLTVIAMAAVAAMLLCYLPGLLPWGVVLAGFALGPFFPVGLDWLGHVRPNNSRVMSFVITGGCVGGIVGPKLVEAVAASQPGQFLTGFMLLAALLLAAVITAQLLVAHPVEAAGEN